MVEKRLETEVTNILSIIEKKQNFLLSGGAGSGKTYSLVSLISEFFEQKPYYNIAGITYTKAAAKNLAEKINHPNLRVSTIHDFLWDMISPFQKELKQIIVNTILEEDENFSGADLISNIKYKEYRRLREGVITHDDVISISENMFHENKKLCQIVSSSFDFILVDEYQDTAPAVIKILLTHLQTVFNKPIIGLFGDSMQAIYEDGIGDVSEYINNGIIFEVKKVQNRRNPKTIIDLGNKFRFDGLIQEPSKDENAPNMQNGTVKNGDVKFLYSYDDNFDFGKIRQSKYCVDWNFKDSKKTKELRLTHKLIAQENNYKTLFEIYGNDPFIPFIRDLKKHTNDTQDDKKFKDVISEIGLTIGRAPNKKDRLQHILEVTENNELYNFLKEKPWQEVRKIYFKIDNLISGKREDTEDEEDTIIERDNLIRHLFKIQEIIDLYQNNDFTKFISKVDFVVCSVNDKKILSDSINSLLQDDLEIGRAIELADQFLLCKKDDIINKFIEKNDYLYFRISKVKYKEFESLYRYLEGYLPFSTQHKIKGLEFDNVLVLLDNGKWNNYNFNYLFGEPGSESVLNRTKKLFYVCVTRAKENLVVYFPKPSEVVLATALEFFGEDNMENVDEYLE